MEAQITELWRMIRPGGQLAITTREPGIFAPVYEVWLAAVRRVRADLYSAFNPWGRISTPHAVHELFADAGVRHVEVVAEEGYQALRARPRTVGPSHWAVGCDGHDQMGRGSAQFKQEILNTLAAKGVDRVGTNVFYAAERRTPMIDNSPARRQFPP